MSNGYYENMNSSGNNTDANANNTVQQPPATDTQAEANEPTIQFPDSSTGQLSISVFTANQLVPVVGAVISVIPENTDDTTSYSSVTDRSGRSETFTLPAPSSAVSQEPTVAAPFSEYKVTISSPDFFDQTIENVQIFGGTITQLPVNMTPLPELTNGETTKIVIIPRQNL